MMSNDNEWQSYILLDGSPVLAKRCECRAKYAETIVIAVHQDFEQVGVYLHQGEVVASVLRNPPSRMLRGNELKLSQLYKLLHRRDVERIAGELEAEPFHLAFPPFLYARDIMRKLSEVRFPGWIYTTVTARGFCLLKDFDTFNDGCRHTVGVTDAGIAVFQSNLQAGGSLCSDDHIFYMGVDQISEQSLAERCCWPDAIEICSVHRSLQRWIFHAAMANE